MTEDIPETFARLTSAIERGIVLLEKALDLANNPHLASSRLDNAREAFRTLDELKARLTAEQFERLQKQYVDELLSEKP
jgi:hypothetical protein